jgi:sigma-E factor negative regulatory protein RseA
MEKVSAWMDGELDQRERVSVLRQSSNAHARESWECYHLIGEALRGELNERSCAVGTSSALTRRICDALEAEPNVLVPAVARASREAVAVPEGEGAASAGRFLNVGNGVPVWKPWLVAASVATAAVVGWQAINSDWRRETAAAQVAAAQKGDGVRPSSVPSAISVIPATSAAISYDRYLQAHDEAAPTTRLSSPRVYIQAANYSVTH